MHAAASAILMVSGFALGVLVCIAVYDERILLNVQLWNHHLLWFMGVLSFVVLRARSMSVPTIATSTHSPAELLDRIKALAHTVVPSDQVQRMFPHQEAMLLRELGAVLLLPLFILGKLPSYHLSLLLTRLQRVTRCHDAMGAMCAFALFDAPVIAHANTDECMLTPSGSEGGLLEWSDMDAGEAKMKRSVLHSHLLHDTDIVLESASSLARRIVERHGDLPKRHVAWFKLDMVYA
jgi:hypothetical protein